LTVTLIGQKQRTDVLNRQLGALASEVTIAVGRVTPALDAVPRSSSTIAARSGAAAKLVNAARPLIAALSANKLPATVHEVGALSAAATQAGIVPGLVPLLSEVPALSTLVSTLEPVVQSADTAGLVPAASTLVSNVEPLIDALRTTGLIPAASSLVSNVAPLVASIKQADLVPRAVSGFSNLTEVVSLLRGSLTVQQATLRVAGATRQLTSDGLGTTQAIRSDADQILAIARQTLSEVTDLDQKVP
jgi:hypothetical protein